MTGKQRGSAANIVKSVMQRVRGSASGWTQTGALPWRKEKSGELKLLLVTSKGGERWIVPKGWPMAGKSMAESALQEALEEAGVEGDIVDEPIGSFAHQKLDARGLPLQLEIVVHSLEVRNELADWQESGERFRAWFTPDDAFAAAEPEALKDLIRSFADR